MKKTVVILAAALTGMFILVGCESGGNEISTTELETYSPDSDAVTSTNSSSDSDTPDTKTTTGTKTETETKENSEPNTAAWVCKSEYENLDVYEITGSGTSLDVYLPGEDGKIDKNGALSATEHGVTVSYFVDDEKNGSVFSVLSSAYRSEKSRIESIDGAGNIEVPDAISGNDWALQEIDFTTNNCPCYSYVKVDMVSDVSVTTKVTLMGDDIDEDTFDVFTEVTSAVGITTEDIDFLKKKGEAHGRHKDSTGMFCAKGKSKVLLRSGDKCCEKDDGSSKPERKRSGKPRTVQKEGGKRHFNG